MVAAGILIWYFAQPVAQHFGYVLTDLARVLVGLTGALLALLICKRPLDFTEDCMNVPDGCVYSRAESAADDARQAQGGGTFSGVFDAVPVHPVISPTKKSCRVRCAGQSDAGEQKDGAQDGKPGGKSDGRNQDGDATTDGCN